MTNRSISPVVKLDNVSKRFGDCRALDRVSVTVHPGEVVAVIGCSGVGNTTLLRCLSRATVASEGRVWFGEEDLAALSGRRLRAHRARVGMIFQQFNLVRRLQVMDNVLIGRLPRVGAGEGGRPWPAGFPPPIGPWAGAPWSTWAAEVRLAAARVHREDVHRVPGRRSDRPPREPG